MGQKENNLALAVPSGPLKNNICTSHVLQCWVLPYPLPLPRTTQLTPRDAALQLGMADQALQHPGVEAPP